IANYSKFLKISCLCIGLIIEEALKILGVNGKKVGRLTPFDKVIVDSEGLKIERFGKIIEDQTIARPV
ncbi:MAG: hypothetical protein WCG23_09980, partial [bacterium]